MQLRFYRTYWAANHAPFRQFAAEALADGYQGLEAPVPADATARQELKGALDEFGFDLIGEICTGGTYVPDRGAPLRQHLDDFARKLELSMLLAPRHINCLAGQDAWPLAQSLEFFGRALELVAAAGVSLSFETHRSRSLFNPWVTRDIVQALPALRLTADFSHWCVVAERLVMDTEPDVLALLAPHVRHIHGRVGYDQGPQVPHPAASEYAHALHAHQRWWEACWQAMQAGGLSEATMTPEFGPDGYLHHMPFTDMPVGDLREINRWMLHTERAHYHNWSLQC
ncbi:MAG: Xylose isomerase domain protein barrel [Moraxellaceae bacterium]|jgi:sugar phosphate isomerase/epimerase|nr:Xylose isomerase domain protein barrel [Moraxellaceae bacterium]